MNRSTMERTLGVGSALTAFVVFACAVASARPSSIPAARVAAQSASSSQSSGPALSPQQIQLERAKVLMVTKRYEEAIRAYQALSKAEPKNAVYLNMIGIAYLDLADYNNAIKYFQRAAKVDKKFSSAVNNIGMIWYEKKDYGRAIKEYKQAIKIDPNQAGTWANLGYAYYNTGKYDQAFADFHKAIEIDPQAFEHNERVGTMLQDKSVSNHGLFFFLMAKEYAKVGDAEHCAGYLHKALDEGYADVGSAATAPDFQKVINDPMVQAVLALVPPSGTATPGGTASTTTPPA